MISRVDIFLGAIFESKTMKAPHAIAMRQGVRERERETERQRDRETERQRERERDTDRQRQRKRERKRKDKRKTGEAKKGCSVIGLSTFSSFFESLEMRRN